MKYLVILFLLDLIEHKIDKNKIVLISIISHMFKSDLLDKAIVTEKRSKIYIYKEERVTFINLVYLFLVKKDFLLKA